MNKNYLDEYIANLCSKYDELTSKGIECDIYVGSPAGHFFLPKESLLTEYKKNDKSLCFMLADNKGQCIFNEEIFKQKDDLSDETINSSLTVNKLIVPIVMFLWTAFALYQFLSTQN